MNNFIKISTPLKEEEIIKLKAGDFVSITGSIYTARDSAHKKLFELIKNKKKLPIDLKGQIFFYAGPTPAKPGYPCGSVGPTSGFRMDPYTPILLENGLKGMIGKGQRSIEVIKSMISNKAIYFVVVGGAAALISKDVKKSETIIFNDLIGETIYRFFVQDFPAIVAIDTYGNNLYESEIRKYSLD
jgi:fumarate hydratase subunit beta